MAFEFRWRDARHRRLWDLAFAGGSLVAACCQGMILGAILKGIKVVDQAYAGGNFDWFNPFTILCGVSLTIGYALLGATWLVWRTQGGLAVKARRFAFGLGIATLLALACVSVATPFLNLEYWRRWFAMPGVMFTAQVPLLTGVVAGVFFVSLRRGSEVLPFLAAIAWFGLGFLGLGISLYPYIVPGSITIFDAAAPPQSQSFMLVGVCAVLPLILAYTGWAYWVFRGKVSEAGYH